MLFVIKGLFAFTEAAEALSFIKHSVCFHRIAWPQTWKTIAWSMV